jgi:hypothetical protein
MTYEVSGLEPLRLVASETAPRNATLIYAPVESGDPRSNRYNFVVAGLVPGAVYLIPRGAIRIRPESGAPPRELHIHFGRTDPARYDRATSHLTWGSGRFSNPDAILFRTDRSGMVHVYFDAPAGTAGRSREIYRQGSSWSCDLYQCNVVSGEPWTGLIFGALALLGVCAFLGGSPKTRSAQ